MVRKSLVPGERIQKAVCSISLSTSLEKWCGTCMLRGIGDCNPRKPHFEDTYKHTEVGAMVAIMKENPVCNRE